MNTDLCLSVPTNPKILCWQERIFLRELRALRGFAVNPGLDFHREGAKHARKTRRTLVCLRLCCTVFICGFVHSLVAALLRRVRGGFVSWGLEGVDCAVF